MAWEILFGNADYFKRVDCAITNIGTYIGAFSYQCVNYIAISYSYTAYNNYSLLPMHMHL